MKQELVKLDEKIINEIKMIKEKYSCLKENVHKGQNRNTCPPIYVFIFMFWWICIL